MTNPDNTVGANAGYNGRTTPNAFNDVLQVFSTAGVLSGWHCRAKSGMVVEIGGVAGTRDVAIAEDNAGNRITIDNRTASPVEITIGGAPASNNRYDTIVAYVNNPPNGSGSTDVDFPSQVGIIAVQGTVAATPSYPTEAQIKAAITADGGNGNTAYYVHLADIYVAQGVTTITDAAIEDATTADVDIVIPSNSVGTSELKNNAVSTAKIADSAITNAKIADGTIGTAKLNLTTENVTMDCYVGTTKTGSITGKLLKFSSTLGVLIFNGSTGYGDSGTGNRNVNVHIDNANFTTILGYGINSWYQGNADAYQTYVGVGTTYIDSYVYKASSSTQTRNISGVVFGVIGS